MPGEGDEETDRDRETRRRVGGCVGEGGEGEYRRKS